VKESTLINIMIDPSLVVARRTIDKTFDLVKELHKTQNFKFYLPKTFQFLVDKDKLRQESPTFKFFQQNVYPAELSSIKTLIKKHSDIIVTFELALGHEEKYKEFFESLSEESRFWREYLDEHTLNILSEEWVFLQEYSMIVSRIKRTFNGFIDAGAACLQFGRKTFGILVRKTLKKRDDELIANVDKLRAFGKWIAVGGSAILPFFNPIVSAFGSLIGGYFLLFDPDATADNRCISDSANASSKFLTLLGTWICPER
jgi:hypothetical protein